jgi:hypothetical protein
MGQMPIQIDTPLTNIERNQLAGVIRCEVDELDNRLGEFAAAALEEYARMFLGQRVFTRGSDMREYRLFLLIKGPFRGVIPHEQQVSDLFQTTTSESRSLVRSVMSKFQYELQDETRETLRALVQSAGSVEGQSCMRLTVDSPNLIEALNRVIASLDGTLPRIQKERGTVASFELERSAYDALIAHFD